MRRYYIYRAEPHSVKKVKKEDKEFSWLSQGYSLYEYGPYQLLGYIDGTRALYDYLGPWADTDMSFNALEGKSFKSYWSKPRYIIMDDRGRIRDYDELSLGIRNKRHRPVYQYRYDPVPGCGKGHNTRIFRNPHTAAWKRKQVSDNEIRNLRDEYPFARVHVKRDKRNHLPDSWDDIGFSKSKSWKDCTKRKHQYK